MSAPESIIEVKPVASTQGAVSDAAGSGAFRTPSYGRKATQAASVGPTPAQAVAQATVIGDTGASAAAKAPSRATGAVQLVTGSAIALVGVPMLILPGPGLLAIGGGVALAASGLKKLRKK